MREGDCGEAQEEGSIFINCTISLISSESEVPASSISHLTLKNRGIFFGETMYILMEMSCTKAHHHQSTQLSKKLYNGHVRLPPNKNSQEHKET